MWLMLFSVWYHTGHRNHSFPILTCLTLNLFTYSYCNKCGPLPTPENTTTTNHDDDDDDDNNSFFKIIPLGKYLNELTW